MPNMMPNVQPMCPAGSNQWEASVHAKERARCAGHGRGMCGRMEGRAKRQNKSLPNLTFPCSTDMNVSKAIHLSDQGPPGRYRFHGAREQRALSQLGAGHRARALAETRPSRGSGQHNGDLLLSSQPNFALMSAIWVPLRHVHLPKSYEYT